MLDALSVKIPNTVLCQPKFLDLLNSYEPSWQRIAQNPYPYEYSVDLRRFGYPFRYCHRDRFHGNNKLEFYGVGQMDAARILACLRETIQSDPNELEITRIDLAVDVFDIPVQWFWRHTRVLQKKASRKYVRRNNQELYEQVIDPGNVMSLYFGKRPNCIRIYDKQAQLKYLQLKQSHNNNPLFQAANLNEILELKKFENTGHTSWTRVERQFNNASLPEEARTMGDFMELAPTIDPFEQVQFVLSGAALPDKSTVKPLVFMKGQGLRAMVAEDGLNDTFRYLNSRGRHARKQFDELAQFLKFDGEQIQPPDLFATFQMSILAQLRPCSLLTPILPFGALPDLSIPPSKPTVHDVSAAPYWVN